MYSFSNGYDSVIFFWTRAVEEAEDDDGLFGVCTAIGIRTFEDDDFFVFLGLKTALEVRSVRVFINAFALLIIKYTYRVYVYDIYIIHIV